MTTTVAPAIDQRIIVRRLGGIVGIIFPGLRLFSGEDLPGPLDAEGPAVLGNAAVVNEVLKLEFISVDLPLHGIDLTVGIISHIAIILAEGAQLLRLSLNQ